MTYTTFDPEQTMRDLLVAWKRHPDRRPIEVLRERKRQRGEWRVGGRDA